MESEILIALLTALLNGFGFGLSLKSGEPRFSLFI